MIRTILGERR